MGKNTYLHHYTDIKGIAGILENKKLWAQSIYKKDGRIAVNDASEFSWGWRKFWEGIIKNEGIDKYYLKELIKRNVLVAGELNKFWHHPLIICFSEYDDSDLYTINNGSLSQWRGYALNKAQSIGEAGYCIVFKKDKLKEAVSKMHEQKFGNGNDPFVSLMNDNKDDHDRVNYVDKISTIKDLQGGENLEKILKEIVDIVKSAKGADFPNKFRNSFNKIDHSKIGQMITSFYAVNLFNKNLGFKEENEYRMAFIVDKDHSPKFFKDYERARIEIDISEECIDRIIIGPPFAGQEKAKSDIVNLLETKGYRLELSEIPFLA